jgi:hypothetical protein
MPGRIHPKKLLVEGATDRRVIPELVEANGIPWEDPAGNPRVFIKAFDGIKDLLTSGVINSEIKATGAEIIGIMVDANRDAQARFRRIRDRCSQQFPNLPDILPREGLITSQAGRKLGVWLMPDNESRGMLETFLTFLAPNEQDDVVDYAEQACTEAKARGGSVEARTLHEGEDPYVVGVAG